MNSERTIQDLEMLSLWMRLKMACCKDSDNREDWIEIVQKAIDKLRVIREDIRKEEAREYDS